MTVGNRLTSRNNFVVHEATTAESGMRWRSLLKN